MTTPHRILTITLNPAIDMTTAVSTLTPGIKLRCEEPRLDPGGGGINISRVIKELGGASTALVAIAGPTGELMRELLAEAGIDAAFLHAAGLTRQSFAVHDRKTGEQYRFVLPGPNQRPEFAEAILTVVSRLIAERHYDYVAASGSLPPGLPDDYYGRLGDMVAARGARLILDTSGPALKAALGHRIFLVKPDHTEAKTLGDAFGMKTEDPQSLAQLILASNGAEAVVVTLGPDGALLASSSGCLRVRPPKVEVVSAVGAGDSFIGALCLGLARDWPLEQAVAYGVAAAAAAVLTPATELAHKTDVERLYAAVMAEPGQGAQPAPHARGPATPD